MVAVTSATRTKCGAPRQVVFSFDEGSPETRTAAVRGGKGAHLAEMVALGLPVPPGFTVTTTVARSFMETGGMPNRVTGQFVRAMQRLERQTGKVFGDPDNPLLVSVRSGAQASMPGMMDTVLNVGLNPFTVAGLARLQGEQFALDAYCRFLKQFGAVVLGVPTAKLEYVINSTKAQASGENGVLSINTLSQTCERLRFAIEIMTERPVPDDPREQLELSLIAVMRSWMSERARAYRRANNLPNWWGTAANVQAMVFGNRSDTSGTGVVFSHDLTTGQAGLFGEFLPCSQGEDIVAGTHQPWPIADMAAWNPDLYSNLERLVRELADHLGDIVDVEFTVEDGELYLLQVRRAKRSALASVTYAVHQVWAGRTTRDQAVMDVTDHELEQLNRSELDPAYLAKLRTPIQGLAASPGAAVGIVATSSADAQELAARGEKVVLVTRDTSPDDLPGMMCAQALITANGGTTCHAAVVAREIGIPAVVGVGEIQLQSLTAGRHVSVDGTGGAVYFGHLPLVSSAYSTKEVQIFRQWKQRFGFTPRLNFDWLEEREDVNERLNDFYLTDAMCHAAIGSPLGNATRELRNRMHQEIAELFATYLLVAVGSEIRYAFDRINGIQPAQLSVLEHSYGVRRIDTREEVQPEVIDRLKAASPTQHAEFFMLCMTVFNTSSWVVPSIGGKAWGKIARAGYDFLRGAMTPTSFVDHVFDLRHNSGRLFDKHAMVAAKSDESIIGEQLCIKKQARSVKELRGSLLFVHHHLSADVRQMFDDGRRMKLW